MTAKVNIEAIGTALEPYKSMHYLDVYTDLEQSWVYLNWKGTPTVDEVKQGVEMALEAMKDKELGKILNDNRELKGTWTGAMDWIVNDWWPRAMDAGFRAIAYIYSPDVFGKFSVDALLKQTDENGPVKQKPFKTIEEAKTWLATH